jgi:hypothetical protein
MEDITKEVVLKLLEDKVIKFKSTHTQLCIPIINRLYKKMKLGISFQGIKVAEDLIIDGHHRYLASLLANVTIDVFPTQPSSATIISDWNTVIFVEEDWDTEAKILMWNTIDAQYNSILVEEIIRIIK